MKGSALKKGQDLRGPAEGVSLSESEVLIIENLTYREADKIAMRIKTPTSSEASEFDGSIPLNFLKFPSVPLKCPLNSFKCPRTSLKLP